MSDVHRVHAPGRVNLIGDHTDYTGGLVLPMAIDRGTTSDFQVEDGRIALVSDQAAEPVEFALPYEAAPGDFRPRWGTYIAAMAREVGAVRGIRGAVTSTIPAGAGLSSSAALACAVGLALGSGASPTELALLAQRAEHAATGVPTGIMDQLCIAAAIDGHATLIDCNSLEVTHVPVPDGLDVLVQFVAHRALVDSAYADRVAECARAESVLGPLRIASEADLRRRPGALDETAWRRACHVVSENGRVRQFNRALTSGEFAEAGRLMVASHESSRNDFETSTPAMDAAVARLVRTPGVHGARMTGGGFGGCVVAICEPGTRAPGWIVRASRGVHHLEPAPGA